MVAALGTEEKGECEQEAHHHGNLVAKESEATNH
jgi:hypothetical protein